MLQEAPSRFFCMRTPTSFWDVFLTIDQVVFGSYLIGLLSRQLKPSAELIK